MGKAVLQLKKGSGNTVELEWEGSWNGSWRNIIVRMGDKEIGHFADKQELVTGKTFKTPMGGDLAIQYKESSFGTSGFVASYDGEALTGSIDDLETIWRNTWVGIFGISLFYLIVGSLAYFFHFPFFAYIGVSETILVFAFLLMPLGYMVKRLRSSIAVVLALILVILEMIFAFGTMFAEGANSGAGVFMPRMAMIVPLFQAIRPIWELNDRKIR